MLNRFFSRKESNTHIEYVIFGIKLKIHKNDAVAIIRLDGMGDYVMMNNFLSSIKQSEEYKNKKIIFIGWTHMASLCEMLNSADVDEFWWLDLSYFTPWGKKFLKKKFKEYHIQTVIDPGFRKNIYTEIFLSTVKPKKVISHKVYFENKTLQKNSSLYTDIIPTTEKQVFEFERMKEFFEKVSKTNIEYKRPFFESFFNKGEKYIFISPFAGDKRRCWNAENYAEIINYIVEKYDYKCVILGSRYEVRSVEKILEKITEKNRAKVINAVNKTTTASLPNIFKNYARLLIANETGTIHIALASGCPFVSISSGSFYKRFQPYEGFENSYIYPDRFEEKIKNNEDMSAFYTDEGFDVNEISVDKVKSKIEGILSGVVA